MGCKCGTVLVGGCWRFGVGCGGWGAIFDFWGGGEGGGAMEGEGEVGEGQGVDEGMGA